MKIGNVVAALAAGTADGGSILADAGMVIVIGLVVVFATLIVLTLILWLFGQAMSRGTKESSALKPIAEMPAKMATAPSPLPAAPVVQNGVSEEVVAVIAAAVAAMAPEGTRYTVRSINRTRGSRPAWAAAGLAESTRPF